MRWLFSFFIILSQVSDYNRVIFIEGEDAEIERVLKERGEASEREDDTEVISKTKLEVYNGNTRPISDSLGDSDKALKVCTWWSRSICLLRLIMLAFFLEDSTHFVAQYIPHIVFPFRRFYVTKFLVTTGFRSVARIFQRVRVGWGGVRPSHTQDLPDCHVYVHPEFQRKRILSDDHLVMQIVWILHIRAVSTP